MRQPLYFRPWLVFLLSALALCFARFRFGLTPLATFDDDFYYYLRSALNLIHTGRSTFDGTHLTNGYHPLWFLVLVALARLVPQTWFFVALQCIEFLLACMTFLLFRQMFRTYTCRKPLADCCAVYIAVLAAVLSRGGMEIALLFPLAAASLSYRMRIGTAWTNRQAATYGLLLSLTVLSRLDSVLLVALWLLVELHTPARTWHERTRAITSFAAGGVLLPLYLLSNRLWFHMWLPVSGHAKQLRAHHWPAVRPLRSIFLTPSPILQVIVWSSLTLMLFCVLRFRHTGTVRDERKLLAWATLVFPLAHLLLFCVLSDWDMWPWYFYPFVLAIAASVLLLLPQVPAVNQGGLRWVCWSLLAVVIPITFLAARRHPAAQHALEQDLALTNFIRHHAGTYAMGDESGMLGYMAPSPIVQTEGLMEDGAFLNRIQSQLPLAEVLREYGADYYITGASAHPPGCFTVKEPAQAGPDSRKLQGEVCQSDALFQGGLPLHQIYPVSAIHSSTMGR